MKNIEKTTIFILKSKVIHGKLYNYSKVEYINSKDKVDIICNTCNFQFSQTPNKHLSGKGCPECAKKRVGLKHRKTTKTFIKDSISIHGNKFDYSKVNYIDAETKVEIICPIHGSFFQRARNHTDGYGCSACGKTGFDQSKSAILYYLKVENNNKIAYKIGITNKTVKKRFGSDMKYITILNIENFTIGKDALKKESSIIQTFKNKKWHGDDLLKNGNTELFTEDILNLDI